MDLLERCRIALILLANAPMPDDKVVEERLDEIEEELGALIGAIEEKEQWKELDA